MEKITKLANRLSLDGSAKTPVVKPDPNALFSPVVSSHLEEIYASLTASSDVDFFKDIQHESPPTDSEAGPLSSLEAFKEYMAGPNASALQPAQKPDLTVPITDFFISSSHNTYLTGNQLSSDSDASAYTTALLNGCRCVEIDVWDGDLDSDSDDDVSSSSESSSDDEQTKQRKKEKQKKKEGTVGRRNTVSKKLNGLLGRKSPPAEEPAVAPAEERKSLGAMARELIRPEPKVLHGHTLTKDTTFRDVCHAIRDSAFVKSDLPVIVSLEVHASLEQQETMVEIMEDAWKGMLIEVTPEIEATKAPPPLETLRRRILIKVKYVAPDSDTQGADQEDYTDDLEGLQPQPSQGDSSVTKTNTNASAPPPKPSKISQALSRLAVFTKGFHFSHFAQPEAKVPGHVFSLSEKAARAAYANDRDALFEHNRRHFMRVYPFGLRVDSSNLDPTFYWRRGAQIVALNWQSLDKGMMLNRGLFTGEEGWVRKPQGYLSTEESSAPVPKVQLDLSIEFIAAQNLPLPPGDTKEKGFHPYVSCYLHVETPSEDPDSPTDDATTDSEKYSYKRETKSTTGCHPDFKGQKVTFPTVTGIVEDLTFVRFKVKDHELCRDSLAAWACIKLTRLREGYRLIHLYDCAGVDCGGAILVRVTKKVNQVSA
ncbi:PLC-like phosphodiesterase [Aspergillus taichungensis]|uniref:Phosphoinositide phospholipase C n=1 Tax=Aspergillus taichungensis TaxID=482145 RepID=A0A2J5I0J2_9EURO|nr:PLC-like phosphodiesterase [Aspergillus taichungensis]